MSAKQPRLTKSRKVILSLFLFVILMFFVGYALVPLYNVLCNVLGLNGKTSNLSYKNTQLVDKNRTITVTFVSQTNDKLKWQFRPNIKKVELHPGENVKMSYFAKNDTNHTMTVQAIPSVTPGLAAVHLKKTECFCFNQQTLKAGQSMDMPLIFHLDNSLPKNINELTLSYTLFKSTKQVNSKKAGKLS